MNHNVQMLPEAENDLVDIYNYVVQHDSTVQADKLLDSLELKCTSLINQPERGHGVPELERIHAVGFREIHLKPFRIIYQIEGNNIFIHAVIDGRRELQELLERRLLR
jgi:toxin ParE1/3/4